MEVIDLKNTRYVHFKWKFAHSKLFKNIITTLTFTFIVDKSWETTKKEKEEYGILEH